MTKIQDASSIDHSKAADSPEIVQLLAERLADGSNLSTETGVGGLLLQKTGDVFEVIQAR